MKFKPNVEVHSFVPEMWQAAFVMERVMHDRLGDQYVMLITSANDEAHRTGSLHYTDHALDVRSHDMGNDDKHVILDRARVLLGEAYGLILENEGHDNEHFHLQVGREGLKPYWT